MNMDADWIAALVAPWTISPHPNFAQDRVSWPARLALVVEQRAYELPEQEADEPESRLVELARRSIVASTIREARDDLIALTQDGSLGLGLRTAAATFAGLAASELEEADVIVPALSSLLKTVRKAAHADGERILLEAALLNQLVLRNFDSGDFSAALTAAQDQERVLSAPVDFSMSIEVSRGLSWGPAEVLADIVEMLRSNAVEAIAYLEQYRGDRWRSVIRSRSGWIDMRLNLAAARRDRDWITREFDRIYESNSGIVRFGGAPRSTDGYEALLVAELGGSLQKVRSAREMTARLRGIELAEGEGMSDQSIEDALRYFRQARIKNPLRYLVRRLRDLGPTDALIRNARGVIARVERTGYVSDFDLIVLEGAAEFFAEHEIGGLSAAARKYESSQQLNPVPPSTRLERIWAVLANQTPSPQTEARVALELLEDLERLSAIDQPFANTALRVMRRLDWSRIEQAIVERWISVIEIRGGDGDDFWRDARAAVSPVGGDQADVRGTGLRGVAARLDAFASHDEDEARTDWMIVESSLLQERQSALRGVTSFGPLESLDVAVAFVLRHPNDERWARVLDFLFDENVMFEAKRHGIRRIARSVADIPPAVQVKLAKGWPRVANSRSSSSFDEAAASVKVRPEYLEAGMALKAFPAAEARDLLVELSIGASPQKLAVATSLAFLDWSSVSGVDVIASQLLAASDPAVRSEAAHSIACKIAEHAHIPARLEDQLKEGLQADGSRVKLRVLQGFALGIRNGGRSRSIGKPWDSLFRELAQSDPSSKVRRFASELLKMS